MQDHHKLDVWERAHRHAVEVRRALRELAGAEHASMRAQVKRAAESIVFNIVEGCYSRSSREFARFLDISIKSSGELEGQLELARDYECLPTGRCKQLCDETIEIRRMLCGLRRRVIESDAEERERRGGSENSPLELDPPDLEFRQPREDSP